MSCRLIRRELLRLTRFREFGPDSERHLEHLAGCRACRDEVGCDRHTVRLLRAALEARVEGLEPSSAVWEQVRDRAQASEPSVGRWPWRRLSDVMAFGRTLTAVAGTGLALVLALNTQVVTVTLPQPDAASSRPLAAGTGVPSAWDRLPRPTTTGETREVGQIVWHPDPEGLVTAVDAGTLSSTLTSPVVEEPVEEAPPEIVSPVRPRAPEPPPADEERRDGPGAEGPDDAAPSQLPAGAPT